MASGPYAKLVGEELQAKRKDLRRISMQLWSRPELAYQEREAHALLCKMLEDEGFSVTRNFLLETGFKAEFFCPSKEKCQEETGANGGSDDSNSEDSEDGEDGSAFAEVAGLRYRANVASTTAPKKPIAFKDRRNAKEDMAFTGRVSRKLAQPEECADSKKPPACRGGAGQKKKIVTESSPKDDSEPANSEPVNTKRLAKPKQSHGPLCCTAVNTRMEGVAREAERSVGVEKPADPNEYRSAKKATNLKNGAAFKDDKDLKGAAGGSKETTDGEPPKGATDMRSYRIEKAAAKYGTARNNKAPEEHRVSKWGASVERFSTIPQDSSARTDIDAKDGLPQDSKGKTKSASIIIGKSTPVCSSAKRVELKKDSALQDWPGRLSAVMLKPIQPFERKPRVAFLCEYDALPGIGHACGHNLIAESGLAMALMAKRVICEAPPGTFEGSIVVLGTPAEEGGGGKIKMMDAFKEIDAAFMIHPSGRGINVLNATTMCSSRLQASFRNDVDTVGDTPHLSRDLNVRTMGQSTVMEATTIAYTHLSMLRNLLPDSWGLCVLLRPMVDENEIQLEITYRSEKARDMMALRDRIIQCITNTAQACKCQMNLRFAPYYLDQWTNRVLTKRIAEYCSLFREMADEEADRKLETSTDVGNISQILPTVQVFPSIHNSIAPHEKPFAEIARSEAAEKLVLDVALACAKTALDFLADSKMRHDAWEELATRQRLEAEAN
ncbi:peptidase M20 domain-containing protein 2-like [Tropilaelaps mercedesae]|uniref:Peptidase M20 domain-containing protein 2-like n=1 Tax=Tropilaelaps mercedesae TaxID=418985 RepID=A0A1V9XWE2_9ACAR|nr:peptidase M20 domain-containing protein 2-like [Tropilaelaps mercedesae]